MVRRRPLTPAAAMPHATLAWPQARPRGPCDAQPRAYHGPSDFRLWAPVGRTAHARDAHLLGTPGRPCCCCRRRPAFRPRARASAGFKNARLAPASVPYQQRMLFYINKGFPTLFNTPDTLCSHVPPPDRVYMYSLEIALRLAHIRKIHLYFSTHRPLSARCDPSRVSCIPPRARAATCIAPNAPRGPQLYDHM